MRLDKLRQLRRPTALRWPPQRPLTGPQAAIVAAIAAHWELNGYGPTLAEIAGAVGSSPQVTRAHLLRLERRGAVVVPRDEGRAVTRAIRVAEGWPSTEPHARSPDGATGT